MWRTTTLMTQEITVGLWLVEEAMVKKMDLVEGIPWAEAREEEKGGEEEAGRDLPEGGIERVIQKTR